MGPSIGRKQGVVVARANIRDVEASTFAALRRLDELRLWVRCLRFQHNDSASAIFHRAANSAALRLENVLMEPRQAISWTGPAFQDRPWRWKRDSRVVR